MRQPFVLLLFAWIWTVAGACKSVGAGAATFRSGSTGVVGRAAASPSLQDDDLVDVVVQLEEVRAQWTGGSFGELYSSENTDGFPGIDMPLDVVRAANLATSTSFRVNKNAPFTSLGMQIKERLDAAFEASSMPYVLSHPPTQSQGGTQWSGSASPEKGIGLAYSVNKLESSDDLFTNSYATPAGDARYWLLFRPTPRLMPLDSDRDGEGILFNSDPRLTVSAKQASPSKERR